MVEFYVEPNTTTIPLGRQGENLARTIYFELSELISNYGEGTATLVYLRSKDSAPYVCDTTQSGNMLSWTPTDTDTAYAGAGKCELRWVVGDVLAKSIVYRTFVTESITGDSTVPSEYESWYEALLEHISEYEIASDQIAANTSQITANTSDIAVLDGRMDEFTKLPDGSSTGDAELADIRVGADGARYETAGKAVRKQIANLKSDITDLEEQIGTVSGLSKEAKTALLNCFQHVAWTDEHGQTYYNALESALYADSYPKITAKFNPGLNVIYTDDTLDSLKQYLTVKYYETEESTGTVIASANYSLSGSLVEGASTVFVSYSGLTTSFVIDGVVDYYNIWNWSMANGDFSVRPGTIDYWNNETNVRYTFRAPWDTRRGVTAPKGLLPYRVWGSDTDMTSYYPIPIPKDANKVTISITPNTQYIYTQVMHVSNGNVTRITSKGWSQGTTEVTFDKGENNAVFFNTKYDSDGSTYPTDPTEITIAFEEV